MTKKSQADGSDCCACCGFQPIKCTQLSRVHWKLLDGDEMPELCDLCLSTRPGLDFIAGRRNEVANQINYCTNYIASRSVRKVTKK